MRASRALAVLFVLPSVALAHRGRPAPVPCPDDVAAAIATECSCDGMRNHGEYMRCVVHYRNALRRSGCLSDAQRSVVRCAARSTCGRPLAVIAKASGANVMLALYSSPGADPDRLVASTAAVPMTVGAMEIPVAPTSLPAGTYWMMGVYDTDASIGIDENDPNAPDCYAPHAFSSALPDPFGTAFPYTGQRFNYYVRVQ